MLLRITTALLGINTYSILEIQRMISEFIIGFGAIRVKG